MEVLLFQPFQTVVRGTRTVLVSTAYSADGFSQWGESEWETMVFPRTPEGKVTDWEDELEQFRCFSRKEALERHLWCVEKYASRP